MKFTENWVNNKGINIHYIDNEIKDSNKSTILVCPGLSESAQDYEKLMSNLGYRRCIALSFRGRGKSDSPTKGYTLKDHVSDIVSVVDKLRIKDFYLLGYSRGASYALSYAISKSESLKGLIIGEYPAKHKKMYNGWAKEQMDFYKTHCGSISIKYEVLQGIENESDKVDFKQYLNKINCPFLLLKGELEESLVSEEDILEYVNNIGSKSIRIEKFESAGHAIIAEDFEKIIRVINEFL